MDNLVPLLTTAGGRISRKTWWFGVVILLVASIVLSIVFRTLGISQSWAQLLAYIVMFLPNWSIGIKRRHDRDSNAMDFKILMGLSGLITLLQAFGIGVRGADMDGTPMPTLPMSLAFMLVAVYALYIFFQLGILRGTTGTNSYGPDPLDGAA